MYAAVIDFRFNLIKRTSWRRLSADFLPWLNTQCHADPDVLRALLLTRLDANCKIVFFTCVSKRFARGLMLLWPRRNLFLNGRYPRRKSSLIYFFLRTVNLSFYSHQNSKEQVSRLNKFRYINIVILAVYDSR